MRKLAATIAAMSVLVLFGLPSFVTASIPPSYDFKETIIHVYPAGQSIEYDRNTTCEIFHVYVKDLLVRDMHGNVITQTTVGSQVMIEATVTNPCDELGNELLFSVFEVRDGAGITKNTSWLNSTIGSNKSITISNSWVAPNLPGEYEAIVFNIECIRCPMILTNVLTYDLTVLPAN